MLRVCAKAAKPFARNYLCERDFFSVQSCRRYTVGKKSHSSHRVITTGFLALLGGVGGTVVYAKWDPKFRTTVENNVPYSDWLFGLALGPSHSTATTSTKKQPLSMMESKRSMTKKERIEEQLTASPAPSTSPQNIEEASAEAAHIISAISEIPSVPAPHDTEAIAFTEKCKEPHNLSETVPVPEVVLPAPTKETVKERCMEEVAARLSQQDQDEQNILASISASLEESLASSAKATLKAIGAQEAAMQAIAIHTKKLKEAMELEAPTDQKSAQWKDLQNSLGERSRAVADAGSALLMAKGSLDSLRKIIDESKGSSIAAIRPLILAAEENLYSMVVDLDQVANKVQSAESEAKIVSQYTELVNEAKTQFQKELSSITPEVQANWKGLAGKLSVDDLNALIAHAHRRIDQLHRELAEQRVREQIHIEAALDQQKLEDQKILEKSVNTAKEHSREEARIEQERKLNELREVMEAEMRIQLRRQAAAHTDHLKDVLKIQEQELRAEAEEVLNMKTLEQETNYRRLTQEQLDNFTLDMNAAYARLKGMEEAIDSHVVAEKEAHKAHQLWLSVEALRYNFKTAAADAPTRPLQDAFQAIQDSCHDEFALALASALPEESLSRGIYSEESLRSRFYSLRALAQRVALIDESHNTLYQYVLSYIQATLLFDDRQKAPPTELTNDDLDTFKLLSYAAYSLEQGDLELAAKLVNQLRGESRRVVQDWLTEARLTLETKQVVSLLSAYANAVGLGTTQEP